MSKKEEIFAAVRTREIRNQEEIKRAITKKREKKWIQQLFSFRESDIKRLDGIRAAALKNGVNVSRSQIVRAAIAALSKLDDIQPLVKDLDI